MTLFIVSLAVIALAALLVYLLGQIALPAPVLMILQLAVVVLAVAVILSKAGVI